MPTTDLTDHFIIAMPGLQDANFDHSVTYICEHDDNGSFGLIINRQTELKVSEVIEQMKIGDAECRQCDDPIYIGGPVQPDRGFILHSPIGQWSSSLQVNEQIALTTSKDILEAIARNGYSHTFAAAVAGFEYTMFQVRDSAADIGLLLEYQYDGRNELEPFTVNDNDVFVGTRLALNDTQDTSVLAGVAWDADTGETFLNVEAERRFGDDIAFELRIRAFSGAGPQDLLYSVARDDYVQLQIAKFF